MLYLHDIPLNEAQDVFQSVLEKANLWRILGNEIILLNEKAVGRVLAEAIWAKISSPHYHASAMDGFAVKAEETSGAQPTKPIELIIQSADQKIGPCVACYVDTGDVLPRGFNAVVPIENVEALDHHDMPAETLRNPYLIKLRAGVAPWTHVRPMGEDLVASSMILPAGHQLQPADLGAIAAGGHAQISVAKKPRIAIIPTGSELVPLGTDLKPGDILEYNSIVLAAQVKDWGGLAYRYPITVDDLDGISARVHEAARKSDLILLNAGSSAGAEDYSKQVIEKLGTVFVHGIAIRPGHPVILGMIKLNRRSIPIIGVPGYPVSAALTGEIFVKRLISRWIGRQVIKPETERAVLTRKVVSNAGDDDYIRVAVGKVNDRLLAAPLSRGAGVITSLVKADGLVILPRGIQGANAGEIVDVHINKQRNELEKTIFCIGSHDMTLDILAETLAHADRRMVSVNVGSQGGLISLARGEAHLAGSHLLDPETGEYNLRYVKEYLADCPVRIYGFVTRMQGLIVNRGNPKKIIDLAALTYPNVTFINRQRGAGTRVLLDYHLTKLGMNPESIQGYNQEEYTHLAVAAAVASGRADCCIGISAAANALGLDFIPLFEESYQLIIPVIHARNDLLLPIFEILNSKKFQDAVMKLPGYKIDDMGKIMAEV